MYTRRGVKGSRSYVKHKTDALIELSRTIISQEQGGSLVFNESRGLLTRRHFSRRYFLTAILRSRAVWLLMRKSRTL